MPPTINSILLPVDLSETSENAFFYALQLAKKRNAHITLLHCIIPGTNHDSPLVITPYAKMLEETRKKLHLFYHKCSTVFLQHSDEIPPVTQRVVYGELSPEINKFISQNEVDLIVIGTKGSNTQWRNTFGTMTSHVVGKADRPVITVPDGAHYSTIEKVCVAIDLNGHPSSSFQSTLSDFLKETKASFHFLHICSPGATPPEQQIEQLKAIYKNQYPKNNAPLEVLFAPEIIPALLQHLDENNCDLLIMQRTNKDLLQRLFTTSHTRQAVLDSRIPLLIIPE